MPYFRKRCSRIKDIKRKAENSDVKTGIQISKLKTSVNTLFIHIRIHNQWLGFMYFNGLLKPYWSFLLSDFLINIIFDMFILLFHN